MPYAKIEDLPPAVREHLPHHAQQIFRAAFNIAYARYAGSPRGEEIAQRIAWAAVKRSYVRQGHSWEPRQ